ncbi:MAG TPA: amidase [Candidatus Binataceae bacterium]
MPTVPQSEVTPLKLDELTITDLQDGMNSGRFTARSLVESYLRRIDEIDRSGPCLNSVIELNPDALAIADTLDLERQAKRVRGPLHGVSVLLKDNLDTADRMMTTAGSRALVGSRPPIDSFVARRLREAGAVILGKTNMSEWAYIRSRKATSGWSGRGGLTRNPYALDRNPCGSSSGSGVAVSANLCGAAIGTETDGSIVCPASTNGIVGIKPTVGLISRSGIIPISHTQDSAGPMCRTVSDAAIVLGALTGIDPDDDATSDSPIPSVFQYTQYLDRDGLKGARIGVVRHYFAYPASPLMEAALEVMRGQGAVLVDPAAIETIGKFDRSERTLLLYELKADLNAYLARLGPDAPVHTLREVIEFNLRNASTELRYFGQDLLLEADAKGSLTSPEYLAALANNHAMARMQGIDAAMDKWRLDALVAPVTGPAWVTDLVTGDHIIGGGSQLAAVAGYPSVNVPAGFIFGLPVGISFFGRAWSEPTLLRLAFAFEQASNVRKTPRFLPSADLSE